MGVQYFVVGEGCWNGMELVAAEVLVSVGPCLRHDQCKCAHMNFLSISLICLSY